MGAYECFMQTEFGSVWSPDQNFTGRKMGRKLTILNRYILVDTNFDGKWFVIFKHTINRLCFGYVRLSQPEYFFFFFFVFFLFLFRLSTFKPLNALYSKFERLKIPGRTFVRLKSEVPGWGFPSIGSSKILNF